MRDSERRDVGSSSVLVMTGIALALCLCVSKLTNNRAELLAAITAMRVQDGNLVVRSDSEYVVRFATGLLHCERRLNNEGMRNCGMSL